MIEKTEHPDTETRDLTALIGQLAETEHALHELLAGQADAVLTPGGRMLLLHSAQERLTHDEEVQRCAAALQRGILDGLPANIALLDRNGVIVTVNATWRQFGFENGHAGRDASAGDNYLTICEEARGAEREEALAAAAGIRQVLEGARPMFSLEYSCHSAEVRRWFRMTATPLPDVAGGAVVMHVDVTERRVAEDTARAGESRFRAILESGADVISLSDSQGRILFASPSTTRVLGYDPATEVTGRDMLDFIHPDDRACFGALFQRALASPRTNVRGQARVRHRNGSWRVVEGGFTNLMDEPGIGAVVGNFRDITEEEEGRRALDRMFDLSLDMLSVSGFDGSFKRVNAAFERVLGYSEAELLRHPYIALVHPDDVEKTTQAAATLASGDDLPSFENRYRCEDGSYRWFQWACRSFPAEQIIYSVTRDVTAQKQAIDVLRQSEANLALAQKVAGLGSWKMEWHTERRAAERLDWSDETFRILGLQPGEVPPCVETFYQFVYPDDRDRVRHSLEKAMRIRGRYDLEHRIVHRDGAVRVVHAEGEIFPLPNQPEVLHLVGVLQDVTEQRHAEREEARLAAIVESSDDAIIGTDLQGGITSWNSGAYALYGFTAEEMIGRSIVGLSTEERHAEESWILEQIARGQPVRHLETERRGKFGTPVSVSITVSPVRDRSGRIVGTSKIVRNITQRKEAERALEAAQRRLVVASRQAGMAEVASNVLHNVGNVLNGVNISAELVAGIVRSSSVTNLSRVAGLLKEHALDLAGYLGTSPQGKQLPGYLELLSKHLADEQSTALRELESLRHSIDHIKEVIASQQDHARRGGVVESVPAAEIMEDALRIAAGSLDRHGVGLVRKFDGALQLRTDKHQVVQILLNLLRNACDALRDAAAGDRMLTVGIVRADDDRLCFVVADNGPGIAPENLPRLFEHGFTTRHTGHGFGLHSAALLAQDLGGTLAAASEGPGHGATFRLELPLDGSKWRAEP